MSISVYIGHVRTTKVNLPTDLVNSVERLHIAVFASGRGSNFQALLQAIEEKRIPNADIVLVVSNNSDARALEVARKHDIPAVHLSQKQFATEEEFNHALLQTLENHSVSFVALAGYMKRLDPAVIQRYRNRIINIHPALLPAFGGKGMYGAHVHEAVIASGTKLTGVTVHIVDEEYDHGPIVLQRAVPVEDHDSPETLAAKVLTVEHQLYSETVRLFAEGKVRVNGRRVYVAHN
ncbi:MAG: phosphoribosylglycinamide formyltransferase [Bacteroidota bacterium]